MWNNDQRKQFGNAYVLTAKSFDKELSIELAMMAVSDLEDLDFQSCMNALKKFRNAPTSRSWPKIGEIRSLANPTLSRDAEAMQISSRISEAVSKFGWPNADRARQHIGEKGWVVVSRYGGWGYICENLGVNISQSSFIAQCRDIAKSYLEHEHLKPLNESQQLTSGGGLKKLGYEEK